MCITKNEIAGDRIPSEPPHVKSIGGSSRPYVVSGFARIPGRRNGGSADHHVQGGNGAEADGLARVDASVAVRAERGERIERESGCRIGNRDNGSSEENGRE